MSRLDWIGTFAAGLIAGALLMGQFFALAPWLGSNASSSVPVQEREYGSNQEGSDDVSLYNIGSSRYEIWGDSLTQFLIMIAGLGALFVSVWAVRLLRRTLEATNDTVRAADDAVSETRRIGEAQARAYVAFSHIDLISLIDGQIMFRPMIRNTGLTPATLLSVIGRCMNTEKNEHGNLPDQFTMRYSLSGGNFVNHRLGSQSNFFITVNTINIEDASKAYENKELYIVLGKVAYKDIFFPKSEIQTEEFCYTVRFIKDPSDIGVSCG